MTRFIVRRLFFFVFAFLLTSALVFALTRILPGDVARVLLGREASEAELAAVRAELDLDQPLPTQYINWLTGFLRGDLGETFSRPRTSITDIVFRRTLLSSWLGGITLILAVPLSLVLGIVAGLNEGKPADTAISLLVLSVVSLPEFVIALVLINVVAQRWDLLPASSAIRPDTPFGQAFPSLLLPAITATLALLAYLVRLTRAGVIEELKRDYVMMATLKGMPFRTVMFKHVLRNALIPTVTAIANSTGWLISGLVVIEVVFSYPGLGRLLIFGIDNRDLPLVQAVVMVTVIVILSANLLADVLYALLNPRIRFN
jgi:peptide/nickel transport system permease protein